VSIPIAVITVSISISVVAVAVAVAVAVGTVVAIPNSIRGAGGCWYGLAGARRGDSIGAACTASAAVGIGALVDG
jgi:hypothetical protein